MKKELEFSAYDLIYQTIGAEVKDELGQVFRVDDVRTTKTLTGYYEYHIGLQKLGEGETKPLLYVNLERYDQLLEY